MTEQENKARVRQAIDHTLSGLEGNPYLFQRVAADAEKGANHMKHHFPKGILIALIVLLCMGTAVAAGGLLGGTMNWQGDIIPDENMPSALPTVAPVMTRPGVDFNEDMLDQLTAEGTMLMVWQRLPDGTEMPETDTRMVRKAETEEEFLALMTGNQELPLPGFIPEGYEFVRGEVYYQCLAGGEWKRIGQQALNGGFVAEWYAPDKADEIIEGYHLFYRESPEDYHYLSIDARLSERQDVQEHTFGYLAGMTPSAVQVPGMDYALAIISDTACSLHMLRDMNQPTDFLRLRETRQQELNTFAQVDVTVSAPLLDTDTLIRMFAAE